MQHAVGYDAHAEIEKAMFKPGEAKPEPISATNEEAYLLRPYDHWQVVTDLRNWHTLMVSDRMARAERYAAQRGRELDPDKKVAADKRKRYLTFILMREINHPLGDRGVAQIAFDALFPTKKRG